MLKNVCARDLACLVLRLGLGIIFLVHGGLKVREGWGSNWEPELGTTPQLLVAWGEVLGGAAVLVGAFSRIAAVGLGSVMLAAMYLVYTHRGFLGADPSESPHTFKNLKAGAEYNFVLITQCIALVLLGPGSLAVDRILRRRPRAATAPPHTDIAREPAPTAKV